MSTLKADTVTAATTNGNLAISNQGTGGIAIDGMPHRNLIINGDMRIAQRGTSFATVANGAYTLDRWRYNAVGAGAVTITQDTSVPSGTNFTHSLKVDVTTADASLAASDQYRLLTGLEGYDTEHLNLGESGAVAVTASFWVKSPKTGQHTILFNNNAGDSTYPATYSVSSADTWEQKSVTVTMRTSGTWLATNLAALFVQFPLAFGSDYHGTVNAWNDSFEQGNSSNVNCMDNTANNFYLTGVQLEVGAAATDFEHREYGGELARCQRYFHRLGEVANEVVAFGGSFTTSNATWWFQFPVEMRAAPTQSENTVNLFDCLYDGTSRTAMNSFDATIISTLNCHMLSGLVSSSLADNQPTWLAVDSGGTGYIDFDAEL
jgi:hypothetical protein